MNKTQFYVAIGLPLFPLLVVFLANNRVLDSMRNEMRAGMEGLRAETRAGFERVDQRISDTNKRVGDTNERISRLERRLDAIDTEIRINHDNRLAALEARVLGRAS